MTTTFQIHIRKETGFVYAKAVGIEGHGDTPAKAIYSLVALLATKLNELEGAAKHNALNNDAVMEMTTLRGVFSPKEPQTGTPVSMVCKK